MVRYVVLGGGVGGVTCAEELSRLCSTTADQIYLVSESRILKIVTNVQAISKTTETFDLVPTDLEHYRLKSNFHVLQGTISHIDRQRKVLVTHTGTEYPYDKLCLATGARPKVIVDHPHVIGIRDIESVDELCARLSRARRVMVVGNGGIALELLNEIRRVPLVWTIKDAYLGNTFLDAGASQFFMPHLFTRNEPQPPRLVPSPSLGGPQRPSLSPGGSGGAPTNTAKLPLKKALAVRSSGDGGSPKSAAAAAAAAAASKKRKADGTQVGKAQKHGGAALGPVWRTSLIVPSKPSVVASDRDLVIETEATVQQVWGGDEYLRLKKRRRTSAASRLSAGSSPKLGYGVAAAGPGASPGSRTTSPLARELTVDDLDEQDGQPPTFAASAAGNDSPALPDTGAQADEDVMDWDEQPAPKPAPRVHFVPHLGRFGEGQLGLTTHEDLEPGEKPKHFPPMSFSPSSHLASLATRASESPSSSTGSSSPIPATPMLHTQPLTSHTGTGTITNPHLPHAPPGSTLALSSSSALDAETDWPLYVRLSNNKVYGVDFLISATGVQPNSELARAASLSLSSSGGIQVDKAMRTSDRDIFAVGDCVTCDWHPRPAHWFQMRLWSQARLMGLQAARGMVRDALIERAVGVVPSVPGTAAAAAGTAGGMLTPFSPPGLVVGSPAAQHGQQGQDVVLVGQDMPLFEPPAAGTGTTAAITTTTTAASGSGSPPSASTAALAAAPSPNLPTANALSPPASAATGAPANVSPSTNPAAHFPLAPHVQAHHPAHTSLPTTVILASGDRRTLPPPLDVHFDLFAHVSRFFGFKVVLLGLFNAQGLAPGSYEVLVRSTHPGEYVKLVKDRATNQLRGAMLIGETDLEEMFENLILTGADVSFLEEVVMEPDMELEAPLFEDDDGHAGVDLMMEHPPPAGTDAGAAGMSARHVADMLAADFAAEAVHSHSHAGMGMGMGMGLGLGMGGYGGNGNGHSVGQQQSEATPVGSPEVPMSLF
ncbi:hypothetical protein BCR44DRAFT_1444874 [Catenaria anguillulae PL171]|uniref:FAD/NAD(P)-binding domain-containing protein n=1 Tax=Catenaria anguillulae PL171 TaxID=765915 RepID=A0A1Y2H762_9FUNG|nr:hypothetical protein BCR44DRAFT_1444874 [Catenaria anguillulae PL171]